MTNPSSGIEFWLQSLGEKEIPVMRQTVRAIAEARKRADRISSREIAVIVMHDPLMTARLLRFILRRRSKRQLQEISTVESAVLMLGVEPFFHHFAHFDVIDEQLKLHPPALLGLLHVIRRAQRACRYAWDWALWRSDLGYEEIAVAALLHDLAEMLMWCFAPRQMQDIHALQKANPSIRSADAQKAVLGFPLVELQAALCKSWQLPELLLGLMDGRQAGSVRVRNVKLAVDLARRSADGWDEAALQDDFRAIEALMNIDHKTLRLRLGLKDENPSAQKSS